MIVLARARIKPRADYRRVIHLRQVRGDVTGGHPLRIQRDDRLVEAGQAALMLAHDLRLKRPRPVPRDLDRHLADIGADRLRRHPVPRVRRTPTRRIVPVIAQVLGHLDLQRGLQDLTGQRGQQTVVTGQLDPALGR